MTCDTPPPSDIPEYEDYEASDDEFLSEIIEDPDQLGLGPYYNADLDDSLVTFTNHKDAVFCCSLDNDSKLVCSGGQDETAYVWNMETGDMVFECIGHKDSVISTSFNYDSSYVATSDMNGIIQAWDVKNCERIWNFETSEITWMDWHPNSNTLFAGTTDGECWKWGIPHNEVDVFQSFGSEVSYGNIFSNGEKAVIGYQDGSLRFWDICNNCLLGSVTDHKGTITDIKSNSDNGLVLSASVDGTAKLVKSSNCKVLWNIECSTDDFSPVESVGFLQTHSSIATALNFGFLDIWDISSQIKRSSFNLRSIIVKIICDSSSPLVFVATATGVVHLYDLRTANNERKWVGHSSTVLDFCLSKNRDKIITASEDKTCKVFKISQS